MRLIEVSTPQTAHEFLHLPIRLYKNDKNWIRPLDKDVEDVFNPKENKFFRHGELCRWILQNDQSQTIGRVAAFINKKTANTFDQPTGGMGFFECIEDQKAAFLLFDACKQWLVSKGMEAMDGPVNFGERDKWWGLLVDGFTEPNYCMPYNFGYYHTFFEAYGFKDYFQQYTYSMPVQTKLPEIMQAKADRIARDPGYSFQHFRKKDMEKFAEDFLYIYNKAWSKHAGVKGMTKTQGMSIFKKMMPLLDEKIIWFGYYEKEPIGFFIMIPEVNQLFKHVGGKLDLLGKVKFMYHKLTGSCRKMFGVAFGIIPEFQGKGLEGALVMATAKVVQPLKRYDEFQMNWIGDFNPQMIHICESVGAQVVKTHITYRLLFDPTKPFQRAPVI